MQRNFESGLVDFDRDGISFGRLLSIPESNKVEEEGA